MKTGHRAALCLIVVTALGALTSPLLRVIGAQSPALSLLAVQAETPEVAILGDSRPHVGIGPRFLSAALAEQGFPAVSAHNYAEDGTDVLHHHAVVVTGLLARPEPPRVIVWATNPLGFDDSRKNNRLDQLPAAALPSLARAGAPLELLLDVATMAVFPPYRARPAVKLRIEIVAEKAAFALAGRQGALGLSFDPPPERRIYKPYPDGQVPFAVFRDWDYGFELSLGGYLARYDKLVLGEHHFRLAAEMAARARDAGVLLVILEMPLSPSYRQNLAERPVHQLWRARMSHLADVYGALWLSHADYSDDDHAFGDPGHMQEPLAERYSRYLAQVLAGHDEVKVALSKTH